MVFKCKGIVVLSFFQRSQGDLQASISFFPRLLCLTPLVLFWFLAFPFDLRSHGQCAGKNWRSNETTPGNVSLIFSLFFFSLFFFLLSLLLSAFIHFFFLLLDEGRRVSVYDNITAGGDTTPGYITWRKIFADLQIEP
jgi:hypothetical protein